MRKVINFVKGKRDEKRFSGASDVVTVRNLSPEGELDEDVRGYDVDLTGKDKTLSKLHKAAWTGNLEKLKGSMRKTDLDLADKQGRTPLHLAAVQGHSNIVWFLISNRAKLNVKDHEGKTPLLKAIECKQQECGQLLLERGSDVNVSDNFGNTGLHIASAQGCNELSAALLRKGAKLESPNKAGECALHLATRGGHKEMAEFLLRYGSEVNLCDADERTPLMLAAKTGNQGLVSLFLEYGADCAAMDSNGWTAEDYAVLGGHSAVATELQARSDDLQGSSALPPFRERAVDVPGEIEEVERQDVIMEEEESQLSKAAGDTGASSDEHRASDAEMDSPRSLPDMPPSLKPPRSWDLIQAGLTMPKGGVIPRQRNVFPRPRSWDQRSASLANSPWDTPTGSPVDPPPASLTFHSLTRPPRTQAKKPRPTSLPVTLPESLRSPEPVESKQSLVQTETEGEKATDLVVSRDSLSSDWDSEDDSLPLDNLDNKKEEEEEDKKVERARESAPKVERRGRFLLRRTVSIDLADEELNCLPDKESATLGREGTMQGSEEVWHANATLPTQSPDSSSSSEDFFFQSSRGRGASLKHQSTVIQAHIESSNSNKPSAIPEGLELDSSPELENKLLAMTSSITKESLDFGSSPDVEEKILKITNSQTKESLNVHSSPDIEEKLLEMSTSLIKQSFDLESSPEVEDKLIELVEVSMNGNENIGNEVDDIDSSPDFETKMMEDFAEKEKIDINNPNNIEIPQLLLQNLADMDSSPDLEDQKMLDLSASIIPECSETEMSPETEENNIETQIEQTLGTLERDNKNCRPISNELEKLIIASEPQEKNVLDTSEKEKLELKSDQIIVDIPQHTTPGKLVIQIKDRSLVNSAIENINDDEKENNPAPPPRKKKSRATSLSRTSPEMAANSFKRSLSLGPSRPERKPRRQIKEHWEGNNTAIVRARKRHQDSTDVKEIDLSDRDSIGTHSDDTSLCYTKSPHAVLKRRLRAVTADRARLEHVLSGFEDQNRRIQYELADALHAARTQREISTQLAKQLAKSQKGHLQALEENQALQLQLNASNTELNWLRNLYEEGKSVSPLSEKEDARLEWEHQHQLEQLRAEKSKVLIEKAKIEQQHTSEICKLKEDVLKWMKLYESSTRNSSGNVSETQQEKARLEALVTSLRTDLEMSLRKQNATEKELVSLKQGNVGNNLKDAATNTQQGPSPETLSRELTAEKERSRRGVQQVRKLRAEVQSLRSRVLAAERRSQSSLGSGASGGSNPNYSPVAETEPVSALRRQLEDLSRSVEEERAQRATLEATICDLRTKQAGEGRVPEGLSRIERVRHSSETEGVRAELERVRRGYEDEKGRRTALEQALADIRAGNPERSEVTRGELDKVRRSYEVALARAKQEAELCAREELSLKLAQVNTFLEEQLQQQSRLEQLRCTSESQLRQDFQQTRHKLLNELAKVQATLKARNDEDRRLRKQMTSPRSEHARSRISEHVTHSSGCHHDPISSVSASPAMKPLRPAAAVLSMLVPNCTPPPPGGSTSGVYTSILRRELESSIRKAAEAADRDEPILSDPDDAQLAALKKKYFL